MPVHEMYFVDGIKIGEVDEQGQINASAELSADFLLSSAIRHISEAHYIIHHSGETVDVTPRRVDVDTPSVLTVDDQGEGHLKLDEHSEIIFNTSDQLKIFAGKRDDSQDYYFF